jgi:hypothetical protein
MHNGCIVATLAKEVQLPNEEQRYASIHTAPHSQLHHTSVSKDANY